MEVQNIHDGEDIVSKILDDRLGVRLQTIETEDVSHVSILREFKSQMEPLITVGKNLENKLTQNALASARSDSSQGSPVKNVNEVKGKEEEEKIMDKHESTFVNEANNTNHETIIQAPKPQTNITIPNNKPIPNNRPSTGTNITDKKKDIDHTVNETSKKKEAIKSPTTATSSTTTTMANKHEEKKAQTNRESINKAKKENDHGNNKPQKGSSADRKEPQHNTNKPITHGAIKSPQNENKKDRKEEKKEETKKDNRPSLVKSNVTQSMKSLKKPEDDKSKAIKKPIDNKSVVKTEQNTKAATPTTTAAATTTKPAEKANEMIKVNKDDSAACIEDNQEQIEEEIIEIDPYEGLSEEAKKIYKSLASIIGHNVRNKISDDSQIEKYIQKKIVDYENKIAKITCENEQLKKDMADDKPEKIFFKLKSSTKDVVDFNDNDWVNEFLKIKLFTNEQILIIIEMYLIIAENIEIPSHENPKRLTRYAKDYFKSRVEYITDSLLEVESKVDQLTINNKIKLKKLLKNEKLDLFNLEHFNKIPFCMVLSILVKESCEYMGLYPSFTTKKINNNHMICQFNEQLIEAYNQRQNRLLELSKTINTGVTAATTTITTNNADNTTTTTITTTTTADVDAAGAGAGAGDNDNSNKVPSDQVNEF